MTVLNDRGLGHNLNGQMTAEVFYEYTKHAFTPHLGKNIPLILLDTGHSTI